MNEILEALKAKYTGVSDTILKVKATAMHKKGFTASAVESTTWDEVILAYGDDRATQAAKTALENKPADKPADKGGEKGGEQGKGGEPANETVPAWAKELISQNKTLAAEVASMKGEKVTTARKTQLDATIADLPENLRAPYKRMALEGLTDEEFTALQKEVKTEVDGIVAQVKASGASFATPPATPGGAQVIEATAAEAAELIKNI